jgi:quercetin dioxygenase-like cupin family protein
MRSRVQFFFGMLAGAVLVTAADRSGAWMREVRAAPQAATATKSSSKIVLENARVRVKDVTFAPGEKPPMHTHDLAHVGVILTAGSLVFTDPGKPSETVKFEAGSVGFRDANATHQVANGGTTLMRVIEVELK